MINIIACVNGSLSECVLSVYGGVVTRHHHHHHHHRCLAVTIQITTTTMGTTTPRMVVLPLHLLLFTALAIRTGKSVRWNTVNMQLRTGDVESVVGR